MNVFVDAILVEMFILILVLIPPIFYFSSCSSIVPTVHPRPEEVVLTQKQDTCI